MPARVPGKSAKHCVAQAVPPAFNGPLCAVLSVKCHVPQGVRVVEWVDGMDPIVRLVISTGYSFNLNGLPVYLPCHAVPPLVRHCRHRAGGGESFGQLRSPLVANFFGQVEARPETSVMKWAAAYAAQVSSRQAAAPRQDPRPLSFLRQAMPVLHGGLRSNELIICHRGIDGYERCAQAADAGSKTRAKGNHGRTGLRATPRGDHDGAIRSRTAIESSRRCRRGRLVYDAGAQRADSVAGGGRFD